MEANFLYVLTFLYIMRDTSQDARNVMCTFQNRLLANVSVTLAPTERAGVAVMLCGALGSGTD
jgi:hypothetical protein